MAEHADDIRALIAEARGARDADDPARWEALSALQGFGDRATLDAVAPLLHADDPADRVLAADVLGQLGVPERTLPGPCFEALAGRLKVEDDPAVLGALGVALGHLGHPEALPAVLPLAKHADARARFGAVFGLMHHEDAAALDALVTLSADEDAEVRNWATFALGSQTEADTPAIRAALRARLDDTALDAEIRGEALVGLAERGDAEITPWVHKALADGLDPLAVQAASLLGDPALHPALLALRGHPQMTPRFRETLDEAIARCDPDAEV